MPVTPAFERWRQEDRKFKASLGYTAIPYLKKIIMITIIIIGSNHSIFHKPNLFLICF
jgi:hypothetical protein